jgi:hypothetical protein
MPDLNSSDRATVRTQDITPMGKPEWPSEPPDILNCVVASNEGKLFALPCHMFA